MSDKQQWVAGVHAVRSALKFGRERINEIIYDATRKDRRLNVVLDDAKSLVFLSPRVIRKLSRS